MTLKFVFIFSRFFFLSTISISNNGPTLSDHTQHTSKKSGWPIELQKDWIPQTTHLIAIHFTRVQQNRFRIHPPFVSFLFAHGKKNKKKKHMILIFSKMLFWSRIYHIYSIIIFFLKKINFHELHAKPIFMFILLWLLISPLLKGETILFLSLLLLFNF